MNRLICTVPTVLLALATEAKAQAPPARIETTCTCLGVYQLEGRPKGLDVLAETPLVDGTRISSAFGMRTHPIYGYWEMHCGADIAAPLGTPVHVTSNGIVAEAGRKGGYGNFVLVVHSPTYDTAYAHLGMFAPGIYPGAHVHRGDVIGTVGSSGVSTGPHLHYEVAEKSDRINPSCGCLGHVPRRRRRHLPKQL